MSRKSTVSAKTLSNLKACLIVEEFYWVCYNNSMRKILVYASFLALLDQITKALAVKYLASTPFTIIKNFFLLEYSENHGVAFGIDVPFFLIILLNIILIPVIIYLASKELDLKRKLAKTATALLIAGAFGNFIDRLTNKYVIDFIAIGPWPNFNLADMYICIAVLLILGFYDKIVRSNKNQNGGSTKSGTS